MKPYQQTPHDLKDFDADDSFRLIDSELAGSLICWGALVILILRDVVR